MGAFRSGAPELAHPYQQDRQGPTRAIVGGHAVGVVAGAAVEWLQLRGCQPKNEAALRVYILQLEYGKKAHPTQDQPAIQPPVQ